MKLRIETTSYWQQSLKAAITDYRELCHCLQITCDDLLSVAPAIEQFALRVPREFVARMQPGNVHDPLLLQVLPQAQEMLAVPGYSCDPLHEADTNPLPGLLHKYQGRVLLTLTGACAVNCRYCFRRHFPYEANLPGGEHWQAIIHYIQQDNSINEVIFSGGDPLLLKDAVLARMLVDLESITHLTTLRIHTRLPIVIPSRITDKLVTLLQHSRLQTVLVLHCNHANEIDQTVEHTLQPLLATPITLLNQSVLLKGVNDSATILAALSKRLFAVGVLPYYLHVLDKVQGAAHFAVSDSKAQQLMQKLRAQLPGYLVPSLVREVANQPNKVRL